MRPPVLLAALSGLLLGSCFSPGDGQAPPLQQLYFPTGLVLDATAPGEANKPSYLYVASSDFDLQYRSASLASYDLTRFEQLVPQSCGADSDCDAGFRCDATGSAQNGNVASFFCVAAAGPNEGLPCGAIPVRGPADQLLYPGRCSAVDPQQPQDGMAPLLHDTVGIGAFATDVILRTNPDDSSQARLFLPVRGDATLHWIDLVGGSFRCGQDTTSDNSCDGLHRAGDYTSQNTNQLKLPPEPFGIDASADGHNIAVTNQTTGNIALFINDWALGPSLQNIAGYLPLAPVAIASVPVSPLAAVRALPSAPAPGFLVAYRDAPRIDLLRVRADAGNTPPGGTNYARFGLNLAGSAAIEANSIGSDSRGIAIDDSQRVADTTACQAQHCKTAGNACTGPLADCGCDAGYADCLASVHQPNVYVSNRAPASLLIGSMAPDPGYLAGTSELPVFTDSIPLTAGPSRVVLGQVRVPGSTYVDEHGRGYDYEQRVFVVCFDSRRIFIYDPVRRVIDSIVNTGRGPYALTIDQRRGVAYLAHFTDSYLGVISLDQRFPQNYAAIVASIGAPLPPRASK